MKLSLERKMPSKPKLVIYGLILSILAVAIIYISAGQAKRKSDNQARLQELIAQSGAAEPSQQATEAVQGEGQMPTNPVEPAPVVVEMPPLSEDVLSLLDLGAETAKEQAMLTLAKIRSERLKAENEKQEPPQDNKDTQGGFLLADEMPVNGVSGVSFNNEPIVKTSSISSLTLRYASRVDGKLVTYVSIGDKGRMIEAKPGSIIEGIVITSISDTKLCAKEASISRCINVTY
ncbi:hypothetical protein [Aeromonas caviae]|uniref:hypothetical protein n=1 Tax=Aeromonas caviae TaxID=648 RepID=UPI0030DC0916